MHWTGSTGNPHKRNTHIAKNKQLDEVKNTRGLKITSLNNRSLPSKLEQLECLLQDEKIDIMSLSESWLNAKVGNNQIRIVNYKVYRWDRKVKKRGGGICVYVHKDLLVNACVYEEFNLSNEHIELFAIQVRQKCTKPILLISVYRPPQGNQSTYIESLRNTLLAAMNCNKTVVVGDFNLDYNMTTCKAVKQLKHVEREFNLKQYITGPTRVTTTTDSLRGGYCLTKY